MRVLIKKLMLIVVLIVLIVTTSLGFTLTLQHGEKSLVTTRGVGNEITIEIKDENYGEWEVVDGGVTIVENKFIMPENDVVIRAVSADVANSPNTITTIETEGGKINGVYTNYRCSECGGTNHECEVINIKIETANAQVTKR